MVAEHWPSWSFALESLGVKALETVLPIAALQTVKEVRETSVGGSLVGNAEAVLKEAAVDGRWKHSLIFVQGSEYFVSNVKELLSDSNDAGLFGIVPDEGNRRKGKDAITGWKKNRPLLVKHSQTGGVTRGRWKVYSDLKLTGLKSSQVKRVFSHILVSTESGPPVTTTIVNKGDYIGTEQRIPIRQRNVRLAVPSCFSRRPDELVERDISDKEVMSAYDLEENVQKALSAYARHAGVPLSRDFAMEAPLKVLYTVSKLIRAAWERGLDPKRDKGLGLERVEDESDESLGVSKLRKRDRSLVEDGLEGPRKLQRKLDEQFQKESGHSQVASKNDDAPVDVADWDIWTVNNFTPPEVAYSKARESGKVMFKEAVRSRILVCKPGTYHPEKHGRLFDSLRSLLIRRARRNAFKGLVRYLREEYGSSLVTEVVVYQPRKVDEETTPKTKRRKGSRSKDNTSGRRLPKDVGVLRAFGPSGRRSYRVPSWVNHVRAKRESPRKRRLQPRNPGLEFQKDLRVGGDALKRLAFSTWWSWEMGSTLYYWRWPRRYRKAIRDGTKLFVKRELLPKHFKRQMWPSDPVHKEKMAEKLGKVRSRNYILPGEVNSLTGFFAVPKGTDDIRIVYDATACGLNNALWSPNFFLPTIDSVLRGADKDSWFSDIDLGEMFLNYFLDEDLRKYAGVDVRELGGAQWERWERTLMGFRPSPFVCTQTFAWGETLIRGDRLMENNPLRWDRAVLNLPGDKGYNPAMPWVFKWDDRNNRMASDFVCYIDDIRGLGGTEGSCRATTRRVAAGVNYLGQQDAPRKRRPPSKTPGAWAGAMCLSKPDGLYVTCTQAKWEKAKAIVGYWRTVVVEEKSTQLDAKRMEKDVGFLVHISRTFPATFPYLKGFYLTLNSWRKGRTDEGWKYSMAEWKAALGLEDTTPAYKVKETVSKRGGTNQTHDERPSMLKGVPRLHPDLLALSSLFEAAEPVHRLVRGDKVGSVKLAFGDASGGGFGSSWESFGDKMEKEEEHVGFRFGTWDRVSSSHSSNYREMRNLVDTLEVMADKGELNGTELFMFTDNSTAESAFSKGSSSSRELFELVLKLRKLEMERACKLHVSHVSGTRMIAQGSDGLSRGNLTEGVMRGENMHDFIPINKSALERSPSLGSWLHSWTEGEASFLDPTDWFWRGHEIVEGEYEENVEGHVFPKTQPGMFIWTPPPVAAGIAMEELRKSRHKSAESTHIMVIPRLFSVEWRKALFKAADVVLTVPAGHPAWPASMHEPLMIGILLPYLQHRPWELRRSPIILELANSLHQVWKSGGEPEGPLLRKLWRLQRELSSMPEGLARKVLHCQSSYNLQDCSSRER